MQRLALLLCLGTAVGCPAASNGNGGGTPPVPTVTPVPAGPDPQALYEGFTRDHEWRAVLARVGRWRLVPDEPWREPAAGAAEWAPFDVLVADRSEDAVQVVADGQDLFFAAWVPVDDLAETTVATVVLAPAPDETPAAGEPRVRLAGGLPVEVLERGPDWVRVRAAETGIAVEGWMPAVLLGRFHRVADFEPDGAPFDREPAPGTEVRTGTPGTVLAVLRPAGEADVRVRLVGDPVEGVVRAETMTPRIHLQGWIPADAVSPAAPAPFAPRGHTVAGWRVRGEFNWLQVPIGTELRTTPGTGAVVAVTSQGTKFVVQPDRAEDATAVLLRTLWGEATVWVACEPIPEGMPQPLIDTCVPPIHF